MKRIGIALVSSFFCVCLCGFFAGCKTIVDAESASSMLSAPSEMTVVTLCVDHRAVRSELGPVLQAIPGYGKEFLVDTTMIPSSGGERDAVVTRVRPEMMAGKGPDLFFCECPLLGQWNSEQKDETALFPFPGQMLESRAFLPLDSYIANAEFMEWEKLFPAVMEAGKGSEGQMLLPLTYSLWNVLICPKDESSPSFQRPMTWREMAASEDPVLRFTAAIGWINDVAGDFADYSKDELRLTEEELLELVQGYSRLRGEAPGNYGEQGGEIIDFSAETLQAVGSGLGDNSKECCMIPCYNISGGVTVNITNFVAINRNTEHPDEAFRVLDYLLSKSVQCTSDLYQNGLLGMPVHLELGQADTPLWGSWYMSEEIFREFQALRKEVNTAKFPGPLDAALLKIKEASSGSEEALKAAVHKQYVEMQMMLGES